MRPALFLLMAAFLLLFHFVSAIDCSITGQEHYCNEIKSSSLSEAEKDEAYSSILYPHYSFPNHTAIYEYNSGIRPKSPPENTTSYSLRFIRNAWIRILYLTPSVYINSTLFTPKTFRAFTGFNYDIHIPSTYKSKKYRIDKVCKREYSLAGKEEKLTLYFNEIPIGNNNPLLLAIIESGKVKANLDLSVKVKTKHYFWKKYRVGKLYIDYCEYSHTTISHESITISDQVSITLYTKKPTGKATIEERHLNTTIGSYEASNYSKFILSFQNSSLTIQKYYYSLIFTHKPYHYAQLQAIPFDKTTIRNLYEYDQKFIVKNDSSCKITAHSHFYKATAPCTKANNTTKPLTSQNTQESIRIAPIITLITLIFILYLLYNLLKAQIKKVLPTFLFLFLLAPITLAAEECGLTNLASCIPEKIYEYFLLVINAPLLPLLIFIKKLLTAEVSISLFHHLWSIIRYIISFFYIFLFIYSGYIFLTAGNNPIRRSQAKEMLRDTFLMIILIQSSFYIYSLILSISSILNSTMLSMIDPHFFMMTADNIVNIGLQLIFGIVYAITLLTTALMLVLRYAVVSFGVILFPIALFCYFIPPLKGYGRFMLNLLGIFIFIVFIDLLIILGCSMLIQADVFENFKILVMIACFTTVNYTLWLAIKFALKRSANSSIKDDISQAAKYIAMLA